MGGNHGQLADIVTYGPSYTTPQTPPPIYNIQVTVTWDGQLSAPYPVFVNIPYSNTVVNKGQYCTAFNVCDCNAIGNTGYTGYVTLNYVYVRDLFANALTEIDSNESLFNQQLLGTGNWTSQYFPNPKQSSWEASQWLNSYYFGDYFSICSTNPAFFTPEPTYSGSGGPPVFSETQDYMDWRSLNRNHVGVCTQGASVSLNTNNGDQSNAHIPGYPGTICTNKTTYNTKP